MALQKLFGTEFPLIRAPMAGVQGSALAVAVCNAGGLGSLRAKAESLNRGDFSPLCAGQNVNDRQEVSAAALTRELAKGFATAR